MLIRFLYDREDPDIKPQPFKDGDNGKIYTLQGSRKGPAPTRLWMSILVTAKKPKEASLPLE